VMQWVHHDGESIGEHVRFGHLLDIPLRTHTMLCGGSGHLLGNGTDGAASTWSDLPCRGGERLGIAAGLADRDRVFFAVGTCVVLSATYLISVALYLVVIERWNIAGLRRHKIKSRHPPPTGEAVRAAAMDTAINHLIIRPIVLFAMYPWLHARLQWAPSALPTVWVLAEQLIFCMLFDDSWFYCVHRLFHEVGWLYRTVHKQHHSFKHTHVVAVEYAHPIEDVLCNTLATIGGALVLRVHLAVFWLYISLKLWQSIDAHSGYDLPFPVSPWSAVRWMDCAPAHAYHHGEVRGNYGGFFTFWDHAFGTYRTAAAKRKAT